MDDEVLYQPVVAYFTFSQNNLSQITGGNALQVMREAEQSHFQIMNGVVENLGSVPQLHTQNLTQLHTRKRSRSVCTRNVLAAHAEWTSAIQA
jgi:hypothetical protein